MYDISDKTMAVICLIMAAGLFVISIVAFCGRNIEGTIGTFVIASIWAYGAVMAIRG